MIQAAMLIALGFLIASLIGVLLAPSMWARAARLSRKKLESSLPLTLSEIQAAQDQLRASYAVRMRRLETALASAKQKAANQLVDNSRLQMEIAGLKDRIAEIDLQLSERRNAATVLEQQITKRFPELDGEITRAKAELQERGYELQDVTNRLARREEELDAAKREAASYQEELGRLREVLERSSGADKGGRRLRRASQWTLDDYKAEYDRLNLELSRLRQQLAQLQDRDSQQVGVIKGELQKLAELIMISAQPRPAPQPTPPEPQVRRAAILTEQRRHGAHARPKPLPQSQPASLTARLRLNGEAANGASQPAPSFAVPSSNTPVPAPVATTRDEGAEPVQGAKSPTAAGSGERVLNGGTQHETSQPGSAAADRENQALAVRSDTPGDAASPPSETTSRSSLLKGVTTTDEASGEAGTPADRGEAPAGQAAAENPPKPDTEASTPASLPAIPDERKHGKTLAGIEFDNAALTLAAIAAVNGAARPVAAKAEDPASPVADDVEFVGPPFRTSDKTGARTLVERMRAASEEPAEAKD
ncbi:hypothetical protein T281_05570 [Rhodomicrobium udaipurense JA643]|uniref:Uncharacterized protein n=1 Tax=Rhodomicrobium udaipurense TaxID=1202716 RepID=A0A8I1KHA4_9HYPH|nr:hypothetical protein [Rhodomicrobium udaipurense]KAI95436.1 hypothetical protein T281_05570 [Rhodomicrobium udaipurense JA643]MBJ7543520.1 hypothetical protein [Rhodomicrobium udaipurense]